MPNKEKKFLTVAPFQCAWRNDLKFKEAGRGCVAFEAFACNDVTLVFRENVGSQHYHYKRDTSPHYTVILGSHNNRRLKIEVDGKTVVDVQGIGLCSSSTFKSYWISIYDGLIRIGKGRYPFQNVVFEWLDSNPNCSVQYVGLSSWDKHVGYRNVNVLPFNQNHILMWKQVGCDQFEQDDEEGNQESEENHKLYENWGLENFLESWELSDMVFVVGTEERLIPAHKVILQAAGDFFSDSSDEKVVQLQSVTYPILHALLQYVYSGCTLISESQLSPLWALSSQFKLVPLMKQCDETMERFKLNKKLFDSGKNVELLYPSSLHHGCTSFPFGLPINIQRLEQLYTVDKYTDLNVYIDGHGLLTRAHKVILSLWSATFAKMFTNGMSESNSSQIYFRDVSSGSFKAMLEFMYTGELKLEDNMQFGSLLLELLFLADQFGVEFLHQECCKILLECLSEGWNSSIRRSYNGFFVLYPSLMDDEDYKFAEDSVCPILQAVSSMPSCRVIGELCERKFAKHFDYCTTASLDFVLLDEPAFSNIIRHPDLAVTCEERILNAILMWGMKANEFCEWEMVDQLLRDSNTELLFKERLHPVSMLLGFVRFPLLPYDLLKKLEESCLIRCIPAIDDLVSEAIACMDAPLAKPENGQNVRFQHRRSSFKELQYICDGDSNGVFYFVGTSSGDHPWVNPVLSKRIIITASSPTSRYTDPKALVSRTYLGTSFAGPRMEDEHISAWWMVDLGEDHQLMCNYYTLRQDGSTAFIRFWNFQGSLDGNNWTDLRVHKDDQTICKPGQFASWPIIGPNTLLPFRYFRAILTGPTMDVSNPWCFCICYLELYGFFH
ncbi:hypothetical protein ACFE04_025787 [Oxalis oulophora]